MTPDEKIVHKLYEAVKDGNAGKAAECYCDDARYQDIAFDLHGKAEIAAMWRLVCSRRVKVEYDNIRTEGDQVKGHWVFSYTFKKTGNHVHNELNSTFTFRRGKILVHHDEASRWDWCVQAFGIVKGTLLAMMPFKLRQRAKEELDAFKAKERQSKGV